MSLRFPHADRNGSPVSCPYQIQRGRARQTTTQWHTQQTTAALWLIEYKVSGQIKSPLIYRCACAAALALALPCSGCPHALLILVKTRENVGDACPRQGYAQGTDRRGDGEEGEEGARGLALQGLDVN